MRKKLNYTDKMAIEMIANSESIAPCFNFTMHDLCKKCPLSNFPDFDCSIRVIRRQNESATELKKKNIVTQKKKVELCMQYLVNEWGEDRAKQLILEYLI